MQTTLQWWCDNCTLKPPTQSVLLPNKDLLLLMWILCINILRVFYKHSINKCIVVSAFNMCGHVEMHPWCVFVQCQTNFANFGPRWGDLTNFFFTWVGTVQLVYQIIDKTNDRKSFQLSLFYMLLQLLFLFSFHLSNYSVRWHCEISKPC